MEEKDGALSMCPALHEVTEGQRFAESPFEQDDQSVPCQRTKQGLGDDVTGSSPPAVPEEAEQVLRPGLGAHGALPNPSTL